MNESIEQIRNAVADQAADWFVQNRGGPLDDERSAAFMGWLKASPLHVEEYLGIALLARDLVAAADDPGLALEPLLSAARAEADNIVALDRRPSERAAPMTHRRASLSWPRALAAAAALVFVGSAVLWTTRDGERFGIPLTYRTAHGEQSLHRLPDGSVLHLNTDSEVTVRYARGERLIDLKRGQALFEVAHDGQRRFRVTAGDTGVLAVGTAFDVYRKAGSATVTVVGGVVAVYAGAPPPLRPAGVLPPSALRLVADYQVDVADQIGTPRRVNARLTTAWLQQQIAFENRPLGEVAAEFNRYGPIALEIDDASLRAVRISGVFNAYDTGSFTAFLATLNGVVVQRTDTGIHVQSIAAGNREPLKE
jgi:transmembrane sensor